MAKSSAEIRKELAAAEAREILEKKAKKEATQPKFEYWINPATPVSTNVFYKTYDPTCLLYEISRRVINRDEAKAAGWDDIDLKEGGATYLYNIVTRRIVCAVSGGTIYINTNVWDSKHDDYADDMAMYDIGGYLAQFPGGGDITFIIEEFKAARKAASNGNRQ
jgi:hypothetical protein